jgi:hypothetical protein
MERAIGRRGDPVPTVEERKNAASRQLAQQPKCESCGKAATIARGLSGSPAYRSLCHRCAGASRAPVSAAASSSASDECQSLVAQCGVYGVDYTAAPSAACLAILGPRPR